MKEPTPPGIRWYIGAVLAGGLVVTVALLLAARNRSELPELGRVPQFSLTTEAGTTVDENLFHDKISVVDFVFTSCAGICPMMSGRMAYLQEEVRDEPRIQLVSISVDPETDTPEVLKEYGERYGAVPGKWTFLTGPKPHIFDITRRGFHLGLDTEGENAIIHSQKFVLVDGNGSIRGYYDSDSTDQMEHLLTDAVRLAGK